MEFIDKQQIAENVDEKQASKPLVRTHLAPALLTIPQVCEVLNIARATFYKLNATGAFGLLSVPLCSKQLFSRVELEAWVNSGCPHRKLWQTMKANSVVVKT